MHKLDSRGSRDEDTEADKLEEVIQLLVAAGYFRARIKGLSNFDKIVGGLVWCIQVCSFDIEVELLFNDSWNIGSKIALTEKIVRVVKQMKCPYPIEPHQIQGNDFENIFPVVQWLVKKALHTRELTAQYHSAFATYQLEKNQRILPKIVRPVEVYKPVRSYKHNSPESLSKDILLDTILMEYSRIKSEDSEKSSILFGEMVAVRGGEGDGQSKPEDENVIAEEEKVKELVERRKKEMEDGVEEWREQRGEGESEMRMRRMETLRKECQWKEKRMHEMEERLEERKREIEEKDAEKKKIEEELEELRRGEDEVGEIELKVRGLLEVIDEMKKQESEFKKECRSEMQRLEEDIQKEREKKEKEEDVESKEEEAKIESEMKRVAEMKLKMAKLNRQLGKVQRTIDEVPTRSELTQYQKRFVELDMQLAATLKETKQYYTLYNTMSDLCTYLDKEISLINSLHEGMLGATTTATRDKLLSQMEAVVQGIKGTKNKIEKRRVDTKMQRDRLQHDYLRLVEQQRMYVKLVGEFKEEVRRNQMLMNELSQC